MPVHLRYMVDIWKEHAEDVARKMVAKLTYEERERMFGREYADEYKAWELAEKQAAQ